MSIIEALLKVALLGSEWVLYLLIGLSVLSFAAMFERFLYFRRYSAASDSLRKPLSAALAADDFDAAERLLAGSRSVSASVLREALKWRAGGAEAVADAVDSELGRVRPELERGLNLLGTLGNNAPFIGLFGTVLGIIRAFHDLAGASIQGTQAVMSGIAEALVATGVGLLVALPSVAMYNALIRHVETAAAGAEAASREVIACLKAPGRGEAAAQEAS
jgi:biopolymer transport protein ExbB/biopolymer transport protein TolQ